MKIYFKAAMLVAAVLFSNSLFAQIETPLPSPNGTVSTKVGLTDVSVDYYRPQIKGRKIFGSGDGYIVKYGQLWRTGANGGSKITFGDDVMIDGKTLAAGTYTVLSLPNKDKWTVIFYSDTSIGGNMSAYEQSKDGLRVTVEPTKLKQTVQMLTFNIIDLNETGEEAVLVFAWENTAIRIPFKVSYDEKVMASIKENIGKDTGSYLKAANYYLSKNRDLDQALEWIDMYLSEGENSKQFWNVHTKAKILAALGKKSEAVKVATKSKVMASKNDSGDFGYIKRNDDLIASLK